MDTQESKNENYALYDGIINLMKTSELAERKKQKYNEEQQKYDEKIEELENKVILELVKKGERYVEVKGHGRYTLKLEFEKEQKS